jgi:dipeptidase E
VAGTIFAMGGGGFTAEPGNPALDRFILDLAGRREPRICFLPTASGDATAQVQAFYATFGDLACEPTHLSLFALGRRPVDVARHLVGQDVIYVGGGSMRNMLAIWREHRLDAVLAAAWRRGVVLAGLSAGAMCWFAGGISNSGGGPAVVAGLGLLPESFSVHLDSERSRLPAYVDAVRSGSLPPGWAADDGVGLLFRGQRLERIVSSRRRAGVLRVAPDGTISWVEPDLLAGPDAPPECAPEIAEFRRVRSLRR